LPWFLCAALIGPIASLKLPAGSASDAEAGAEMMKARALTAIKREAQRNSMFMMIIQHERITSAHASVLQIQLKDVSRVKLK
jgi:hypothetical protein